MLNTPAVGKRTIATGFLRINLFAVVYADKDGNVQYLLHSTEKVSVKRILEAEGINLEDALVERLR
jgi:hypothetical protein